MCRCSLWNFVKSHLNAKIEYFRFNNRHCYFRYWLGTDDVDNAFVELGGSKNIGVAFEILQISHPSAEMQVLRV
jgi:hypothetical protein